MDVEFLAADCGDFLIWDHAVGGFTETTFFDKDGNPVRVTLHVRGLDHLYNTTNPAKAIEGNFSWNSQLDLQSGEEMRTGPVWHITAPKYGSLYFETGRWVWTNGELLFQTGLATGIEPICEFLR